MYILLSDIVSLHFGIEIGDSNLYAFTSSSFMKTDFLVSIFKMSERGFWF